MKVEERYCHKWASSYVPTGLDATIDYGNLDLKLSNPTDYQMFLECKVVDNTLYVSFWGWKSDSYDLIMTRNKLTNKGSSSYTVKAWRVYYKDGKEIDSESLGSSTYDTENGYVFIDANNDPRAKYGDDVVIPDETVPKNDDSSSSSSSSQSSYSEPSYSSSSSSSHSSNRPSSSSSSHSSSSHSSSSQSSSESKTEPQPEPDPEPEPTPDPAPEPSPAPDAFAPEVVTSTPTPQAKKLARTGDPVAIGGIVVGVAATAGAAICVARSLIKGELSEEE